MSAQPLPGQIRQIGFVVEDLDTAINHWLQLGVGPWFTIRRTTLQVAFRGQPIEVVQSIALANSGELQVELIEQHCDTPSVYSEFLAQNRPGIHQVTYWAEDYDAALATIKNVGWPVVWEGDTGGVRYAYAEPPGGPTAIVELMELNELTEGMARLVRDTAESWDGSQPIRPLN